MDAKTTQSRLAPEPEVSAEHPGAYIRAGDLSGPVVTTIDRRPVSREDAGILGPKMGRFGLDIPVTVGFRRFIVTVPTWTGEYVALFRAFGRYLDAWVGKSIRLTPAEKYVLVEVARPTEVA